MTLVRKCRSGALWGILLLTFCAANTLAVQLSRQEGDRLQAKIDAITKNGAANPPKSGEVSVSEREANSYLAFNAKEKIPKGLTHPEVTMLGKGRLAARVMVDVDEVKRRRQSRSLIDPLNYLSGQVPVNASGILRTRNGRGQFHLTSADISGIPLPKPLLQELVSFFSRTPEKPAGVDIEAPFDLPARIREIAVRTGESVVVQ